jgi:hypothetical protein
VAVPRSRGASPQTSASNYYPPAGRGYPPGSPGYPGYAKGYRGYNKYVGHYHSHGHYHHYYPLSHYYYYPRYRYPYGYGVFGIGFFYYDPYAWAPTWYYNGYSYGYGNGYPIGEIRLDVEPGHAEVFVDGNYAGIVDDFDSSFDGLRLEEGTYRLEIMAPGYETLVFDVQIQPGRKINYRGALRPAPSLP